MVFAYSYMSKLIVCSNPNSERLLMHKTFNLEFDAVELQELHVMLVLRKVQLQAELHHKNMNVVSIALRQLERVSPMLYYIESIVKEHHAN